VTALKTVFDKVPCDSDLEREFAQWLDGAEDVLEHALEGLELLQAFELRL